MTDWRYKGWIPTVLGRLSYRSIGDTLFPDRSICRNIVFEPDISGALRTRHIICYQHRDRSDAVFRRLTNFFTERTGHFFFVMFCSSVPDIEQHQNKLVGAIYVFTGPTWSLCKSDMHSLIRSEHITQDRAAFIARAYDCSERVRRNCDFFVNFELKRDGRLSMSEGIFNTISLASSFNREDLVNQCYYFLRDISHKHQHHDPSSDTILTLYKLEPGSDESAWARHVMYSLVHHLVRAKRKDKAQIQARLRGVIEYAKSFRKLAACSHPSYNLTRLERSVEWRLAELAADKSGRHGQKTLFISILLGCAFLFMALINFASLQMASNSSKMPAGMTAFINMFSFHTHLFMLFLMAVVVMASGLLVWPLIKNSRFMLDVTRLILVLPPSWFRQNAYYTLGVILLLIAFVVSPYAFR